MGVCVCMCATALLKAKTFKAFAIYFSVYLGYVQFIWGMGQILGKK